MYSRFQEGLVLANEKFPLKIEKTYGVSGLLVKLICSSSKLRILGKLTTIFVLVYF